MSLTVDPIVAAAQAPALPGAPARALAENPFPGLRPFRTGEEHLFFGRERQVDALVDKLATHRFLVVVGGSGSGKSSLVSCGLLPALHRGWMTMAGPAWHVAQFRPGADPIGAMAHALGRDGRLYPGYAGDIPLVEVIETRLRMSNRGLVDVLAKGGLPAGTNLLLFVDQFEELFRYRRLCTAATGELRTDDATAFVNLLLEVTDPACSFIHVVLTMRSDFLGDCSVFHGLPERINQGQYLVPRLTRDERRAVIAGPIAVSGAQIDPALLTRLVNDVGDNPDQLSILQHALNRTWARWRHDVTEPRAIAIDDYEAVGTMAEALDRHAEKAYGELPDDRQRAICERIFKALTDTGSDPRGTRRPMTAGALLAITGATLEELTAVVNVFRKPSRSFLMPPVEGGSYQEAQLEADTVVDISHESLMRVWRRLLGWTEDEAQSARMYRRLADAAALYAEGQGSLWGDPGLELALHWRRRQEPTAGWAALYGGEFERTMAFLDRSQDVRDRARAEAEFEQRWRGSWRTGAIAAGGVVFLLCLMAAKEFDKPIEAWFDQWAGASLLQGHTRLPFIAWMAPRVGRTLLTLLVLTVSGMPAVGLYLALAHYGKRVLRRAMFERIAREVAAPVVPAPAAAPAPEGRVDPATLVNTAYAPAGLRLVAFGVDAASAIALFLLIVFGVALFEGLLEVARIKDTSTELSDASTVAAVVGWIVLSWLYQTLPILSQWRATPGMRAAGVYIVATDGHPLSLGRATLRHAAKPLSYLCGLGLLLQVFTRRRQTLHDFVSRSVVLCASPDAEAGAAQAVPGSLGYRTLALVIDLAVTVAILVAALGALGAYLGIAGPAGEAFAVPIMIVGWLLAVCVYQVLTVTSNRRATLGMLAAGLHVTGADGQQLTVLRATARQLLKPLSFVFGIGFFTHVFTPQRQALHDLLSGTVVKRTLRSAGSRSSTS